MLRRGDNPNKSNGMRRHPGGRPTSYRQEYAEQARKFALLGATDEQMSSFFGVNIATFHRWKKIPEFRDSLNKGKAYADAHMADSLWHSGMGYSHPAVKIFLSESTGGAPVTVPYVEHHPPNPTSAIFWLKNRRPDLWRDRKDVAMTGADGGPIEVRVGKIESRVIDADCVDITDRVINGQDDADATPNLPVVRTNVR